ncbi:MAG TPA: hypothetical protein VLL52_04670, partial [Anaerolineae bacterium]|nr:hypothetical protein [Anaerolineae bacterium]
AGASGGGVLAGIEPDYIVVPAVLWEQFQERPEALPNEGVVGRWYDLATYVDSFCVGERLVDGEGYGVILVFEC